MFQANDTDDCSICWDPLSSKPICMISCGHKFHLDCIHTYETVSVGKTCPNCRSIMNESPTKTYLIRKKEEFWKLVDGIQNHARDRSIARREIDKISSHVHTQCIRLDILLGQYETLLNYRRQRLAIVEGMKDQLIGLSELEVRFNELTEKLMADGIRVLFRNFSVWNSVYDMLCRIRENDTFTHEVKMERHDVLISAKERVILLCNAKNELSCLLYKMKELSVYKDTKFHCYSDSLFTCVREYTAYEHAQKVYDEKEKIRIQKEKGEIQDTLEFGKKSMKCEVDRLDAIIERWSIEKETLKMEIQQVEPLFLK